MSGIPQRTIERELSILQKTDMICRVGAPRTGRWKLLKQIDFDSKQKDMKEKNNEQIVFDMFEEVATESIAEARNAYTYEEIDGCYLEAKEIADKARMNLLEKMGGT